MERNAVFLVLVLDFCGGWGVGAGGSAGAWEDAGLPFAVSSNPATIKSPMSKRTWRKRELNSNVSLSTCINPYPRPLYAWPCMHASEPEILFYVQLYELGLVWPVNKKDQTDSFSQKEQSRKETADRTNISHSVFIQYLIHIPSHRENIQSEVSHFNKPPALALHPEFLRPLIKFWYCHTRTVTKIFPWDHQGYATAYLALPKFRRKHRKL